jgi:hypothetical protein
MSPKIKALAFQFASFLAFFLPLRYVVDVYSGLTGLWVPITAFVITTLIAPKFQAITIHGKEIVIMKWMFIKGVKKL